MKKSLIKKFLLSSTIEKALSLFFYININKKTKLLNNRKEKKEKRKKGSEIKIIEQR